MISKIVTAGFVTTAIFQFDARKFSESAFSPKELNEYKKSKAIIHLSLIHI